VDELVKKATDAGGRDAMPAQDHGFMYGRSFYDLDGHHWEVMWIDPKAVEVGPEAYMASAEMTHCLNVAIGSTRDTLRAGR
jgi:uncharacterized protein